LRGLGFRVSCLIVPCGQVSALLVCVFLLLKTLLVGLCYFLLLTPESVASQHWCLDCVRVCLCFLLKCLFFYFRCECVCKQFFWTLAFMPPPTECTPGNFWLDGCEGELITYSEYWFTIVLFSDPVCSFSVRFCSIVLIRQQLGTMTKTKKKVCSTHPSLLTLVKFLFSEHQNSWVLWCPIVLDLPAAILRYLSLSLLLHSNLFLDEECISSATIWNSCFVGCSVGW